MAVNKSDAQTQLMTLEEELGNVERLFATANFMAGNENLRRWLSNFSNFLADYFPNRLDEFKKLVDITKSIKRTGGLSGLNMFREQIGDPLEPFIRKLKTEIQALNPNHSQTPDDEKRKRVFIIHGRNKKAYDAMHTFLLELRLNPIDFLEARKMTKNPSPTIPEILNAAFDHAQAMIILMTPDDIGSLRRELVKADDSEDDKNPTYQCRQNVLFEAGMAVATDPKRVIFTELGKVRRFTDLNVHIVKLSNAPGWRDDLASRLEDAGCIVNNKRGSSRWLEAGDFDAALNLNPDGKS